MQSVHGKAYVVSRRLKIQLDQAPQGPHECNAEKKMATPCHMQSVHGKAYVVSRRLKIQLDQAPQGPHECNAEKKMACHVICSRFIGCGGVRVLRLTNS